MSRPLARELNLDGLVGPTHNYAGLSFGNLASAKHGASVSQPRRAALEGLAKMKFLADLGIPQAVLPPQLRPDLGALRRLGFAGTDTAVIERAARDAPKLLAAVYSASSMWAANAATVSPSADTADGRVHFTPANLVSQFHRSLEPGATGRLLRAIFPESAGFVHHEPLPAAPFVGDEGAANHMRLAPSHGERGVEVFVYGRGAAGDGLPAKFPARQTLEASRAVARLHGVEGRGVLFVRQSAGAIDGGAFHNDVVAVANENLMLYHGGAYADGTGFGRQIREACDFDMKLIEVPEERVSLKDAVETYLFNSQLVTLAEGGMALIAPIECRERENVRSFIDELVAGESPIVAAHYLDVRQSMKNGGGPACLRLRVVLTDDELSKVHQGVMLTDELYGKLIKWVEKHYRETIEPGDLADPKLVVEVREAMDALNGVLGLGKPSDLLTRVAGIAVTSGREGAGMNQEQVQQLGYATPAVRELVKPSRGWQVLGVLLGLVGVGLLVLGISLIASLRSGNLSDVRGIIDGAFMDAVLLLAGSWWTVIGFRWVRGRRSEG